MNTKFFDEATNRWVECEVVWSGKGPMPHEQRDRECWMQRENTLLKAAPDFYKSYPSVKEIKKAKLLPEYELAPRTPLVDQGKARCRICGQLYKTPQRGTRRFCPACRGRWKKKAA